MTFLNAILLGGVLAGAIPIVIHIINRNRFRQIHWGAMHLLEQVLRVKRRRLKIEQLLLLLVRILIPVILALCMARPVLTGMKVLQGKAKTSLVVLFDNSYSMNAVGGGQSHFVQAKKQVNTIINSLPRGSEASVVWMSGGSSSQLGPTFDIARLRGYLSAKGEGFGTAEAAGALEAAAGLCGDAHYVDREIVVVSDFQKVSWDPNAPEALLRANDLVRNVTIAPRVTLFRVGKEVSENISVESLELSRSILGVGQTVRVRAEVKNHGKRPYSDLRVYFRVDGVNRSASQITLGAGEVSQVVFTHAFGSAGSHVVEVYADADPLKADNVRRYSVPVWDRLDVLLVSGDTSGGALESETAFLQIALQPFSSAAVQVADLITAQVVTPDRLNAESLMDNRVVVLANVERLSDLQVRELEDFVGRGGGLLVFGGDRIDRQWYEEKMAQGGRGLLPCTFGQILGADGQELEPVGVVSQHYDHKALELFNDPRNGSLEGVRVGTWYKLGTSDSSAGAVTVAAHLANGDAFLVEKAFGEGRVIQCCTACDDDWSNLPARPCYLPLMQQLVTHLASTVYPPRNVQVGRQLAAILRAEQADRTAIITDPEGRRHEVSAALHGDHCLVEFGDTEMPGLYVLETSDQETIHFVVNTSRRESEPALLSDGEISDLAEQMQCVAVSSVEQYLALDKQRRFGREIWKPLIAAVLALMFVEIALEQRFSMVKQRYDEPAIYR